MGRGLARGDRFQVVSVLLELSMMGRVLASLIASCQHLWERAGGLKAAGGSKGGEISVYLVSPPAGVWDWF